MSVDSQEKKQEHPEHLSFPTKWVDESLILVASDWYFSRKSHLKINLIFQSQVVISEDK